MGRVHEPSFRLVLTDSKNSTKSGRFKEILGSYDPRKSNDQFESDRIKYWLSQGVLPTATVHNLLVKHKIIDAKKIDVSKISKKPVESAKVESAGEAGSSQTAPEVVAEPEPAPATPDVEAEKAVWLFL